jgi:thiamine-phosphate pyrophosphorylase
MLNRPPCRLYLISPPAIPDLAAFEKSLEKALNAGDIASFQLRLKGLDDSALKAIAKPLLPLVQAHDVAFILNDRPDLAKAIGADGVHIGQSDGPIKKARELIGPEGIVGATCHASRHLAMEAAEQGADYVAFGAFFETETKITEAQPELEILEWWQEVMEIPCVAIGGITVENAEPLARAGADFIAVSGGVWKHKHGPEAAIAAFNTVFESAIH